jgi:N-acetylmuramic acid 6-phosphate etherase
VSETSPPLDPRVTERRNPRTVNIDLATPSEIVALMLAEDRTIGDAVASQAEPIAQLMAQVETAFRAGGRLLYAGAGTSGRLGVLDASECPPTFGADPRQVVGIIAGGDIALRNAVEGAEDSPEAGAAAMDAHAVSARDVVVGIAASGTTPFVHGAIARAKALGAITGLVACSPPPASALAQVDHPIVAVTGPEVVTGSTRLKAGTATKLILNMLTTGAFIRIGKTYGNLMVDLKATNVKLTDRSERIVMEVCRVTRDEARALLRDADGRVKYAIVMHTLGLTRDDAIARLDAVGGVIRKVLP